MEPRIQYAKTSDGVNIAFWTLGEGGTPVVLLAPLAWSNIALEWEIPALQKWYRRLAASRMLIRFDSRGMGRSQRGLEDYSLDGFVADLAAVVERLGFDRFDLVAFGGPSQVAILFAVRHGQMVERLVLWGPNIHARDAAGGPDRQQALLTLAERDWDLFVESWTHAELAWMSGQAAHEWADFLRASVERDDFLRMWPRITEFDIESVLPQVAAQTLVIEPPGGSIRLLTHQSTEVASQIPGAELVRLGPGSPASFQHEEGMRLLEEFLGYDELQDRPVVPSGTAIILFADIVDSTALTERLGDAAFRKKARDLDAAMRTIIRDHSGTAIEGKLLGDGVLAVFTSASEAIKAALACGIAGEDAGLPLHLGLHAGDVIREDDNVYGGAVNIASRISGLSAPGEVLVSRTVADLARTSAGVSFEDRGEHALKGIAPPQRVFAVRQG
jgi:class 3 adenylate cyclase/pimeloyl-ACP methyl ester carboxylesterase